MATLTEERQVAWRIQGTGPDPAHSLVIFKKVKQGRVLHEILNPGQVFKRPLFASSEDFEAFAVSADGNLRHEFSRKYQARVQIWTFTLHFKLQFRVGDIGKLALSLSGRDPLERLQEEVASVLSTTARGFSWEEMKREGDDFGVRLREAESADGQGEFKTNLQCLREFAGDLGLDLRQLEVSRSLTEPDLADEKRLRDNDRRAVIARSDQGLALVQEDLNHDLQLRKDRHGIERRTAMEEASQALRGMERLRSILDAFAQGGVQAIGVATGEIRSFPDMQRALGEIYQIQGHLAALAGGGGSTLSPGLNGKALEGTAPAVPLQIAARPGSPLEAAVLESFRHLRVLDGNPQDQRPILSAVLHLLAEAGMGEDADEEFLRMSRDHLNERIQPVWSALEGDTLEFLESILDLDELRERLD